MSSISQSVLMALTVTVNKFASSNVHAVPRREGKKPTAAKAAARSATDMGRRGALLSTVVGAYSVNESRTELLKSNTKNNSFHLILLASLES